MDIGMFKTEKLDSFIIHGELVITDVEKAEVLSNFFASIYTSGQASHIPCVPRSLGRGWGSRVLPTVRTSRFGTS